MVVLIVSACAVHADQENAAPVKESMEAQAAEMLAEEVSLLFAGCPA